LIDKQQINNDLNNITFFCANYSKERKIANNKQYRVIFSYKNNLFFATIKTKNKEQKTKTITKKSLVKILVYVI